MPATYSIDTWAMTIPRSAKGVDNVHPGGMGRSVHHLAPAKAQYTSSDLRRDKMEESAERAIARASGRKVRSPQGSMPANGRGEPTISVSTESATENIPPLRW